jgi:energy-coupling factor transporter ATP-binding protein EcfA2
VFQLLRDVNAAGTAVVMATHDLDLVRGSAYRTIELNHGKVVFDSGEIARGSAPAGSYIIGRGEPMPDDDETT